MKRFSVFFGLTEARNSISNRIFLLFIFVQVLVYFPALSSPRPWSDDWSYIYFASDPNQNIVNDAIALGRPILGFLNQLAYTNDFVTSNLIVIQLLSLFGLFLLQLSVYSKLTRNKFSNPMLILMPLLLILVPGIQGYVYFLSCFLYTWACFLGFISFDYVNSRTPSRIFTGCLLFVLAFLIYPAGAMFYFVSYFIDFIIRFRQEYSYRSNIGNLFYVSLKLWACSAVAVVIGRAIGTVTDIEQSSRIELVNSLEDLTNKVTWVVTRVFVSEFRVFTVASPTPLRAAIETLLVLLLIILLILKIKDRLTLNRFLNFTLLLFLPILGATPNLIILENQFEFRTLTSTSIMSLVLWTYCFQEMCQFVSRKCNPERGLLYQDINKFIGLACILLVAVAAFYTQRDSEELWIKPSLIRDNLTTSALKKINGDSTAPICMVIPSTVYEPLDKLGIYSLKSDLASSWVPEPYMRLKLERFNLYSKREISIANDVTECNASNIIINYRALGINR